MTTIPSNTHAGARFVAGADDGDREKAAIEYLLPIDPLGQTPNSALYRLLTATYAVRLPQAMLALRKLEEAGLGSETPEPDGPAVDVCRDGLSHHAYSLIADVGFVATQLMDKHEVTAASFRQRLHERVCAGKIRMVHERLSEYGLQHALELFSDAVDEAYFAACEKNRDIASEAVYREIARRAGCLLACQNEIARALADHDGEAPDWPSKPTGQLKQKRS